MTFRLMLAAVLALASMQAHAEAIDPQRSEIRFVSRQMGVPIDGNFARLSGSVRFDPGNLDGARAEIQVSLGSIDAGSDEATAEVKRRPWFNVSGFPSAKFRATGARRIGDNRYEPGRVPLSSPTARALTVPFTVKRAEDATVFEGGFTLLRLDFGIGEGVWSDTETVANEVEVRFRLVQPDRA